jgi:hypothetical protein
MYRLMQAHNMTDAEVRQLGYRVLVESLGAVGAARFIRQHDTFENDYLKAAGTPFGDMTADEIYKEAELSETKPQEEAAQLFVVPSIPYSSLSMRVCQKAASPVTWRSVDRLPCHYPPVGIGVGGALAVEDKDARLLANAKRPAHLRSPGPQDLQQTA